MLNNELDNLLKEIRGITKINDIAYHEIMDGMLCPIQKIETNTLSNDDWKKAHSSLKIKVKGDYSLEKSVYKRETVYIENVKKDPNSSPAFFEFGIDSILVIPVIKENKTKGIIVIPSIGEIAKLKKEQVEHCKRLVDKFSKTM